jgi:hypothetical protein
VIKKACCFLKTILTMVNFLKKCQFLKLGKNRKGCFSQMNFSKKYQKLANFVGYIYLKFNIIIIYIYEKSCELLKLGQLSESHLIKMRFSGNLQKKFRSNLKMIHFTKKLPTLETGAMQ